jgi:hypothetical protein
MLLIIFPFPGPSGDLEPVAGTSQQDDPLPGPSGEHVSVSSSSSGTIILSSPEHQAGPSVEDVTSRIDVDVSSDEDVPGPSTQSTPASSQTTRRPRKGIPRRLGRRPRYINSQFLLKMFYSWLMLEIC